MEQVLIELTHKLGSNAILLLIILYGGYKLVLKYDMFNCAKLLTHLQRQEVRRVAKEREQDGRLSNLETSIKDISTTVTKLKDTQLQILDILTK